MTKCKCLKQAIADLQILANNAVSPAEIADYLTTIKYLNKYINTAKDK